MKKELNITTHLDRPDLLESMVEKLAQRRIEPAAIGQSWGEWQSVDTSGIEKYLSGTMTLEYGSEQFDLPFVTSFLFCCTREKNDGYRVHWSMSLS